VLRIEREKVWVDREADVWFDLANFEANLRQAEEHGHFHIGGEIPAGASTARDYWKKQSAYTQTVFWPVSTCQTAPNLMTGSFSRRNACAGCWPTY
jgi:hypothetical protein